MTDYLQNAYQYDIGIKEEDDKASPEGGELITTDIKEGVVYEEGGVKVIAFLVDHYPVVPAFGYRIEYGGHSVVLSGDTPRPFDERILQITLSKFITWTYCC